MLSPRILKKTGNITSDICSRVWQRSRFLNNSDATPQIRTCLPQEYRYRSFGLDGSCGRVMRDLIF